jgi:hypothetical protein
VSDVAAVAERAVDYVRTTVGMRSNNRQFDDMRLELNEQWTG